MSNFADHILHICAGDLSGTFRIREIRKMSIRDTPPHKHASLSFSGRIARYADVKVRMMLQENPRNKGRYLGDRMLWGKEDVYKRDSKCEISKSRCL